MLQEDSSAIIHTEDLPDPSAQLFIVKVWLEELANQSGRALWRGHITHVISGKRRYLQDLGDIPAFMVPYLEGMGIRFDIRWCLRCWLSHLKIRKQRQG